MAKRTKSDDLSGTPWNRNRDFLKGMEQAASIKTACPSCTGHMLVIVYMPHRISPGGYSMENPAGVRKKTGDLQKKYLIRTCCIDRTNCHGQQGTTEYKTPEQAMQAYNNNSWKRKPLSSKRK